MKAFVTGATGFIGANLCLMLAESGQFVHALFRSERKASSLKHRNIKLYKGDLLDKDSLIKGMESCDRVYHLGAFAKAWSRDPLVCLKVNVEGTQNVLDVAVRLGVSRVVVTSTAGVFGPSKGAPAEENSVRTEDFFTDYEASKHAMESVVKEYVDRGVHIVLVNPTRVFGPGVLSQANSVTRMIDMYLAGKWRLVPGDGSKIGNYAYVEDVVRGHILAMERGRPGERYILGGADASYSEFFRTMAEVSGKNVKLFRIHQSVILVLSSLFFLWAKVSGSRPLITPDLARKYLHDWSVSSQKAEKELGYTITPLRDGLWKTIDWLNKTQL